MAQNFGVGFIIGATVAASVNSAFTTVSNKIKQTQIQMGKTRQEMSTLNKAITLQNQRSSLVDQYRASGGTDARLHAELQRVSANYVKARQEALKYGASVAEWETQHRKAAATLETLNSKKELLSSMQGEQNRRSMLRQNIVGDVASVMAVAAPVRSAISFESAMADAAKTIDGMRDEAGALTPAYYELEAAVKSLGRELPLAHDQIAALFAAGGQQGMTAINDLREFATMAAQMAVAFGMSNKEAADAIGGYRTALGLSFEATRSMLDLMNQYANTSSASEKGIADIVRRIGSLGQIAGGSVYFDSNSALVANVSEAEDGQAMITVGKGASVEIGENSKAILVGDIRQDITYKLINDDAANKEWGDNLMAGNGMWDLKMDENGNIKANLQDARQVYGDSMQGADLANAGILGSEAERKYVNDVLTDTSGNLAAAAARFDAAMNPAGALTAFTTAYDRASDLRRIVREESVKGESNRLWAQVTGGKTKLDGISSGAQSIKTDTNVYGLAIGGEAQFTNFMLGAAITAGTGKTENDAVDGTDDFEYYGFSLYGKTSVAGFDLLGDVSATWLKSDFTIGGAADVDTDTTTAVYSFGVQGEKKFEMSWADFTPFIGVDVYHVRSDGFDNDHGAKIDDSDATVVEIPIGARLSKSLETTGGFHMEPSFMLAVVPTIADTEIDSKVRFAGAESTYNFTFADDVKIRSNIGLDAVKDNFTFGLRAGYEWGDEERSSMHMQLRAKYAF